MPGLIRNELMKIFKRPGSLIMIAILILLVTVAGTFIGIQASKGAVPDNSEWRHGLEMENNRLKRQLEDTKEFGNERDIYYIEQQIAINEYRLKHDISINKDYSMWDFVNGNLPFIDVAGMFTIIIAAGIVAGEFNWGTIKLLLIRPRSRSKILMAKYLSVLIFALVNLVVLLVFSTILGALLFGVPEEAPVHLLYYNGKVIEQSMPVYLLVSYLLYSIHMIMLATMSFMISAIFRSSSIAIGVSLFLMFTGVQITDLLAEKYDWAKYSLFANTNLIQYFEGYPMVEGMTLPFSVIMLLIYFGLFQFLAHYIFRKRDITA